MTLSRCIVCLCILVATEVAAETPTEVADATFRKGKQLMGEKRFAEACAAFDRSFAIEASSSTLLNRADCREKNGQLATAWKLFVDAEQRTRGSSELADQQMNATAKTKSAALERRLSRLTIRVTGEHSASFELTVNDAPIDVKGWSAEPVDGGRYVVRAREAGFADWSSTVNVAPDSDSRVIEVPKTPVTVTVVRPPPPKPVPAPAPSHKSRIVPIVLFGAAAVFGAVAFGSWRSGEGLYADAKVEPDDVRQVSLWNDANKRRYLAESLAAGSVVCVGVAIVVLARGREHHPAKVTITPTASTTTLGIGLSRRW